MLENVKKSYTNNKTLFIALALIAGTFIITGSILLFLYMKQRKGRMKANGIQQSTYDLVKGFEGQRLSAYKDIAGNDTIGIGHLILPHEYHLLQSDITPETSYELFVHDAKIAEADIKEEIKFPLNQNQFDALVSLIFNIGVGHFDSSTVLKQLNSFFPNGFDPSEKAKITTAWLAWKNAGGKPVLLDRRQKEVDLFFF